MNKTMGKIAALAVTAAIGMSFTPSATAEETAPPTFEQRKERCLRAIDGRLVRVDRLQGAVGTSEHVTPRHEAILEAQLADAQAGLTRLRSQIRSTDDPAELRTLCRSMVVDFRIYVLVTPRTRFTLGADAAVDATHRLDRIAAQIQEKIDEAAAEGKDVTLAQAEHDSMVAHVTSARDAASPVPDAVLPLEPHGWPGNKPVLDQARSDLRSARDDIGQARQDGHDAVEALKEAS